MKSFFSLSFILLTSLLFSQTKFKVVEKSDDTVLYKGKIGSSPITIFLANKEIIDCNFLETYVEGWYYYDKYKIKIPLSGFLKYDDLKMYNYGKSHVAAINDIKEQVTMSTIDSLYENSGYKEAFELIVDYDVKNWKGSFETNGKESAISLETKGKILGENHEYFKLPNSKQIDLIQVFTGYGGNKFISIRQDGNEKRAIFRFHSISNANACGQCGASDGEKGYRIIYFDKNWKIKSSEEFLTESCLQSFNYTKIIKKTKTIIKYAIKDYNNKLLYYLTIDKSLSKITKTD